MFNRLPLAAACLLAAVALLPSTASAAAKAKPKKPRTQVERFEVKIRGGQLNKWSVASDNEAASCRTTAIGSGQEHIVFNTTKPHRLLATSTHGMRNLVFGNINVDTHARVTREGYLNSTTHDPCETVAEGEGEGGPPRASDCGTREGRLTLELDFDKDTLALDDVDSQLTPFDNCHIEGFAFPDIITATRGRVLKAELPTRHIFDRDRKKLVAEANAYLTDDSYGTFFETTMHWDVTLKRLPASKR